MVRTIRQLGVRMTSSRGRRARPTLGSRRDPPVAYHGIVIKQGFQDSSLLDTLRILGRKQAGAWTLLRIGVTRSSFERTVRRVQRNLRSENGVPFYAHFYLPGELVVVFPQKVFRCRPGKATWSRAVNYGRSVGIPAEELDFRPCRFEDETY